MDKIPSLMAPRKKHLAEQVEQLSLQSRSAAATVLETYELLVMILTLLPPASIVATRRVSQTWRSIIRSSKDIRNIYVQSPIIPASRFLQWQLEKACNTSLPLYKAPGITLHPLIASVATKGPSMGERRFDMLNVRENAKTTPASRPITAPLKKLLYKVNLIKAARPGEKVVTPGRVFTFDSSLDHFATYPPCTTIGIRMSFTCSAADRKPNECVVYVPDGLRMRDLVAVAKALLRQEDIARKDVRLEGRLSW